MHQRIERLHAQGPERQKATRGKQRVHAPQALGGFGNARGELGIFNGARRLCTKQLRAPNAQQRQNSHGQNQNPHAAHPLHESTPHIDGYRQLIQSIEHGRASGRQAGYGFKIGMGKTDGDTHPTQPHHQRHHGAQRQHHPHQSHQNHTMARLQVLLVAMQTAPQQQAHAHGQANRPGVDAPDAILHEP